MLIPSIRRTREKFHWRNQSLVKPDSLLVGRRCLVLDDEFLIALDIQQTLELAGAAHVTCVATASEALALLRAKPDFDVAVLDVKLSGADRNSLGVAALLSAKGTPFVFLTGMRVDDVYAKQFPQAPVVEKPYDAATLLDAVRRALKSA
jgi:two-component system, response regulator PdtaR